VFQPGTHSILGRSLKVLRGFSKEFFEAGKFRKPAKEPSIPAGVSILTAAGIEAEPCQKGGDIGRQ
jgi:hypothetical protein